MFEKADFMISGFAKSGSSSLYNMLNAEAGISMSSPKEPNFFNEKVVGDKAISESDMAEYHSLWTDKSTAGTLYGEASVLYGQRHSYPHAAEMFTLLRLNPSWKTLKVRSLGFVNFWTYPMKRTRQPTENSFGAIERVRPYALQGWAHSWKRLGSALWGV